MSNSRAKLISATFQVIDNGVAYTVQFWQSSVTVESSRWRATLRKAYPPTLLSCYTLIQKFVDQRNAASTSGLKVYREDSSGDA